MDIDSVEIYVTVVQSGSFAEAARKLNVPTTTVSFKIARLEERLGTTLIQRTTRKLHITPSGQAYYERALRAINELKAGEAEIQVASKEPTGVLKITAAHDVASALLPPILKEYLAKYPKVSVDLMVTNRKVDLIAEGVDLAFRAGDLKDSQLIAKKFLEFSVGLWASQRYLKSAGAPIKPEELKDHELILFRPVVGKETEFVGPKRKIKTELKGRLIVDEFESVRALALLDYGIALLPEFVATSEAQKQELVQVLPGWSLNVTARLSLVYPEQAFVTPKLRAFIDLATAKM